MCPKIQNFDIFEYDNIACMHQRQPSENGVMKKWDALPQGEG